MSCMRVHWGTERLNGHTNHVTSERFMGPDHLHCVLYCKKCDCEVEICDLLKRVQRMEDALQAFLDFNPDGEGAKEAKEEFLSHANPECDGAK